MPSGGRKALGTTWAWAACGVGSASQSTESRSTGHHADLRIKARVRLQEMGRQQGAGRQ